ncbi:protein-binding activity modulator [Lithospermum erythrorhizon]|uniref:Protein-binding activity modulator n=1 Tax=Lithospermum erythrorhizon TaxID=34254 RepID=A0AAV3NRV7_LITER
MEVSLIKIWVFYIFLWFSYKCSSLPLCTNLREPVKQNKALKFCEYNGTMCCTSSQDSGIEKRFQAMNISNDSCGAVIKSILCATCDKYSAELFKVKSGARPVPVLCEANAPAVKLSSISNPGNSNFCSEVWDSCKDVSILNSPFSPSLQNKAGVTQNSSASKLIDLWNSKNDFCGNFGSPSGGDSVCFDGKQVELNETEKILPPEGMCLEKIGNGSYLNMVAHPDGSNRAFFSDQPGKIWLATIPDIDSGGVLGLDESTPFVDLTDQVHFDTNFGMMGLAFHPKFAQNGRFFASFTCDKQTNPGCSGRCSCNSDVGCDPSKFKTPTSTSPCQFHTVVAEYSANGTSSAPSMATNANPAEVRRIFTMGLPYKSPAGGQILFGPEDGYVYLMIGDGGNEGDPLNFSQNKKSFLGKILRLDVENMPSEKEIDDLSLWGNYTTPRDNPYADDKDMASEIWAYGLRNPWRCSFDSERPSYFICGDSGENAYEEVDIITKGGNYGWPMYEGPLIFTRKDTPRNTSAGSIDNLIFPVVGYNHSEVNKKTGSASISGGYVYRSNTDPCLYGSYLYGDLYGENYWTAMENPKDSGKFTSASLPFACARDSPIQCTTTPNSPLPAIGYVFSTGQDNKKDVYILTSTGVYRVVRPSRCNYTCSKENATTNAVPSPPTPASNSRYIRPYCTVALLAFSLFIL